MTRSLPEIEKFALVSQVNRAAISIPSNIAAEGTSRKSDKEINRFLDYSLGSAYELETQFLLIGKLYSNLEAQTTALIEKLNNIQMMIGGFKRKISV